LDEATNALDKNTESRILKKIFQEYKDLTIILISHSEENVKLCDKIIKLNN
jgi:ABC-type transport system involved in cytochrome bd biosynthesis fused ATPase/permease subunit